MKKLFILLSFCMCVNCGYAQLTESMFPSSAEKAYIYKYFQDEDVYTAASVKEILDNLPSYLSVTKSPITGNKFKSFDEETDYQAKFTKLLGDCVKEAETNPDLMVSRCNNIFYSKYDEQIADVPAYYVLRHDSLGKFHAFLCYGDLNGSYEIALSYDGGKRWSYCRLVLVPNNPYYVKPKVHLPFIKNDSILQVEVTLAHPVQPFSPKPQYELLEDNFMLQFNLRKMLLDSDNDSIPDVWEKQIDTDPFSKDTDKDSIPDGRDINPTHKNVDDKYGALYRYLLEGWSTDSVVFFNPEKPPRLHSNKLGTPPYIIITNDSLYTHLSGTKNTYTLMNREEYLTYLKKVKSPICPIQISPLFPVDNMPGYYKVYVICEYANRCYLIAEKKDRWIVTRLEYWGL